MGGELFNGDGEEVGGDVSDHHVFTAGRHLRVPVGVSLRYLGFCRGLVAGALVVGQLAFPAFRGLVLLVFH